MTHAFISANVPRELQLHSQWVLWQSVDGKKVPKQVTRPHRNASTNKSFTWNNFEVANAAAGDLGIGFVFTLSDPFVFIDLDWDDQPSELQCRIIKRLDSYTEISPSGAGVHIFVRADKSRIGCATKIDQLGVEIYLNGRYSTITGNVGGYGQRLIGERTDALLEVMSWLHVPKGSRNNSLIRVAGQMRHAGLSRQEISDNLQQVNVSQCVPPVSEIEVIDLAGRVSGYPVSGHLSLPRHILLSDQFAALSPSAKALLIDIAARYTGKNNGQITAPYCAMKERGWKSEGTMYRALKQLKAAGLIKVTKKGFSHNCTCYRLPWAI
jgi:hypothetical protein